MTNAPPSINPADTDTLGGTFRAVLEKFLQSVDDMLPAQIISYDRAANRAQVQPMVMMGTTDGQKIRRAQIASVPVLNIGGGGMVLSFPLAPGDFGWIKASDRDISLFLQSFREDWPNTRRLHSFQDAVFIPDVMRQWTLNGADAERVVLQSTNGAVRFAIGADGIHITGPVVVTGEITLNGIPISTHKHTGVQPGGGNSGGPIA